MSVTHASSDSTNIIELYNDGTYKVISGKYALIVTVIYIGQGHLHQDELHSKAIILQGLLKMLAALEIVFAKEPIIHAISLAKDIFMESYTVVFNSSSSTAKQKFEAFMSSKDLVASSYHTHVCLMETMKEATLPKLFLPLDFTPDKFRGKMEPSDEVLNQLRAKFAKLCIEKLQESLPLTVAVTVTPLVEDANKITPDEYLKRVVHYIKDELESKGWQCKIAHDERFVAYGKFLFIGRKL